MKNAAMYCKCVTTQVFNLLYTGIFIFASSVQTEAKSHNKCEHISVDQLFDNPIKYNGAKVCFYAYIHKRDDAFVFHKLKRILTREEFYDEVILAFDYDERSIARIHGLKDGDRVYLIGRVDITVGCWGLQESEDVDEIWVCTPFSRPIDLNDSTIIPTEPI